MLLRRNTFYLKKKLATEASFKLSREICLVIKTWRCHLWLTSNLQLYFKPNLEELVKPKLNDKRQYHEHCFTLYILINVASERWQYRPRGAHAINSHFLYLTQGGGAFVCRFAPEIAPPAAAHDPVITFLCWLGRWSKGTSQKSRKCRLLFY